MRLALVWLVIQINGSATNVKGLKSTARRRFASGYHHHRGSLSLPLPARHERGEAEERGACHRIWRGLFGIPSLTLSPLLCGGERESTSDMVVSKRPRGSQSATSGKAGGLKL